MEIKPTADELLHQLMRRVSEIKDVAANEFGGLSHSQLNWKANERTWSIGQCLEHIITTNEVYFSRINRTVLHADKDEKFGQREFSSGNMGKRFIKLMRPGGRPFPTLRIFSPAANQVRAAILNDFISHQDILMERLNGARNIDLMRYKISSPGSSLVRFRLGDTLNILVTHEERHIQQARKVKDMPGFPAG